MYQTWADTGRRVPHKPLGQSSRPLPVKAVACSPGPIYQLPGGIGSGPHITFKHRYKKEEELIPKPGPGEYNVSGDYKFKKSQPISFAAPQPTQGSAAGSVKGTPRARPPVGDEIYTAEPGPGHYTNDVLDISKRPTQRSGWVVTKMKEEDPDRITQHTENVAGKTFGRAHTSRKPATEQPGPGAYTPLRDHRGRHIVGDMTARRHGREVHQPKHDKRTDDIPIPGPGAYDISQLDISKRSAQKSTSMAGRPFVLPGEETPGPGHYTARDGHTRRAVHGPRFTPRSPDKTWKDPGPGPGDYEIPHTLGSTKTPITFKHRPAATARSPRCPHQKGDLVGVLLSATGPKLKGTVKEIWLAEDDDTPPGYRVMLEGGIERDVDGIQVSKWDGGVGPGAYDPLQGMGKDGPRYTIQGPCAFTSMSVSEARKTRDNPGPSQYYKDGHMPKSMGRSGTRYTIGTRVQHAQQQQDVGPGGGPSGDYEPKHPAELRACKKTQPGVSLAFRGEVRVQVVDDVDAVRQMCEAAGILDWKGGREWMANRQSFDMGICKDDYCGQEGVFVQAGGVTRSKAVNVDVGPNRSPAKGQAGAPWGAYQNRPRDTIRVLFPDGTVWNYPPQALKRNRLQFDMANVRWPAPATNSEGGPGPIPNRPTDTSPKVSIAFRTQTEHPIEGPGPGQYELPGSITEKGAVIGTGA